MSRHRHNEEGAVSVFLIIILAFVFAFTAVFIDYARIAALHVQTEKLAHAAVRSVMSSYDPVLQQQYGLFAYGEGTGNRIMTKVLNDSTIVTSREGAFGLMRSRLDSSSLSMDRMLGSYGVFNTQIREDMKYRAPVTFAYEIVDKLKPISQEMKEASHTVDLLKRLHKLYEQREAKLDEALNQQRKAAAGATSLRKLIMGQSSLEMNKYIYEEIDSAADAASQYLDYLDRYEAFKRDPTERKERELREFRQQLNRLLAHIQSELDSFRQKHDTGLVKAEALLAEARNINGEMRLVIAQYKQRAANDGYDTVNSSPSPTNTAVLADGSLAATRDRVSELLTSEDVFRSLETGFAQQRNLRNAANNNIRSMITTLNKIPLREHTDLEMKEAVRRAFDHVYAYERAYVTKGSSNKLDQEQQALDSARGSDRERKEMEKKATERLKEAYGLIDLLTKNKESNNSFQELKGYYEQSLAFNSTAAQPTSLVNHSVDPTETGGAAMNAMDQLYEAAAGMLSSMGDEFFQNEYALSYYSHIDFGRFKDVIGSGTSRQGLTQALGDQLEIGNQEAEYIIYGFHNATGNLAAAYGEIFAMRMAIRTMEGLQKYSSLGHPLAVLAAALLYGVEKAIEDMLMLAQQGYLYLSDYVRIKLTYKDHLRLFMMMHSSKEQKLSRMLALIRYGTGVNPAERPTYAAGEVRSGIRLWFLPGVMKMVGAASGEGEDIEHGTYYVRKQAHFSY